MDIVPKLVEVERDHLLRKELLQAIKMIVRVYIIEGNNLSSRDIGGMSDPYIILKLGQKVHNERKNYFLNESDPKFCKHFDFEAEFPGCPMLFIDIMDYDELFGDDLIGST